MIRIYLWGYAVSSKDTPASVDVTIDGEKVFRGNVKTSQTINNAEFKPIASFEVDDYFLASTLEVEIYVNHGYVRIAGFGWNDQIWTLDLHQLKQEVSIDGSDPITLSHEDVYRMNPELVLEETFLPRIVVGEYHIPLKKGQICNMFYDFRAHVHFENPECDFFE